MSDAVLIFFGILKIDSTASGIIASRDSRSILWTVALFFWLLAQHRTAEETWMTRTAVANFSVSSARLIGGCCGDQLRTEIKLALIPLHCIVGIGGRWYKQLTFPLPFPVHSISPNRCRLWSTVVSSSSA